MSGGVEHQHLEEAEDEFGSGRGFETLSASTPNHSDGNREIDSELRPGKSDLGDIKEEGGGGHYPLFLTVSPVRELWITTERIESLV